MMAKRLKGETPVEAEHLPETRIALVAFVLTAAENFSCQKSHLLRLALSGQL